MVSSRAACIADQCLTGDVNEQLAADVQFQSNGAPRAGNLNISP